MYASPEPTQRNKPQRPSVRSGFTLIEILVVITIIVILLGILLVALNAARNRAYGAQTTAVMDSFAQACEKFRQDHGYLPGVVPEAVLAASPRISGTENALLHMMGGYVTEADVGSTEYGQYDNDDGWIEYVFQNPGSGPDYRMKVNYQRIGEGPTIKGRKYSPYFSPSEREMVDIEPPSEQYYPGFSTEGTLPDLVDGWDRPILYFRQTRSRGGLTSSDPSTRPQFYLETARPYIMSDNIDNNIQNYASFDGGSLLSIPNSLESNDQAGHAILAQLIRQPAIGSHLNNNTLEPVVSWGAVSRGSIVLISAGPDGVYFSAVDGPGSSDVPIGSSEYPFDDFVKAGPEVFEKFDDVVYCGGG